MMDYWSIHRFNSIQFKRFDLAVAGTVSQPLTTIIANEYFL